MALLNEMARRKPTIAQKIETQYRYSNALQKVGRNLKSIRKDVRDDLRKVIPVAALARKFGISTSLLWKWIHHNLIAKERGAVGGALQPKPAQRRPARRKEGVMKSSALGFLKRLKKVKLSQDDLDFWDGVSDYRARYYLPYEVESPPVESRAGRRDTAQRKIREACWKGIDGQGLNPRQYAGLIGVSRSSVLRAIESHVLDTWNPTPHRTLIGKRPRTPKKVRKRQRCA